MREFTKGLVTCLLIAFLGFGVVRCIQHVYVSSTPAVCSECHCVVPGGWCCCEGKCKPKCTCVKCDCPQETQEPTR